MGKKSEKVLKDKPSIHQSEESITKTPEPYQCVGNFAIDFTELWKEQNPTSFMVPIYPYNKRGFSPPGYSHENPPSLQASKKGPKEDKKPQSVNQLVEPEQISQDDKEILNVVGFKPKHFPVKPNLNSLKPVIYVETDNVDRPDNITEISIRRWKVDESYLDVFDSCFATATKLTTLNFWRVGLTSELISKLANILIKYEHIKVLTLENNSDVDDENYHELIKPGSHLTKLHLRYCDISPHGTKLISDRLSGSTVSMTTADPASSSSSTSGAAATTQLGAGGGTSSQLLVLDLSGNKVGDHGAAYLAKALKVNRTLLSLTLSNCDIGDGGCSELAKCLSQYILTNDEIFARRQLKSEQHNEVAKSLSPPLSRRGDSKDRPTSVRSSSKEDKAKTNKTGSKNKKEAKEEKHEKPGKGKKEEKSISKKAAALADVSKANSKIKGRSMRPSKAVNQMETMSDVTDGMENKHPLLSKVDEVGPGKLLIQGNFVLLLLNLARNRVTEEGLSDLYKAVEYQSTQLMDSKVNGTGLVKLFIQRNKFNPMTETSQNIQQLISNRDRKTKTPTVDE